MNDEIGSFKAFPSRYKIAFVFIVILMISLACNLPGDMFGGQSEEAVGRETMIAGTLTARAEEKSLPNTETPPPPTDTPPEVSTDTPTITPSKTTTPTPESALVHVTGNTFCRTGPGNVYDQRGVFHSGQESEIIARDPSGNFWYVVNPDNSGERCWIWGRYATPEGPTAGLPVYTPPPTPTPYVNFSFSFSSPDCGAGKCGFWFEITNTGTLPLESVWVKIESQSSWAVSTPTHEEGTRSDNTFYTSVSGSTIAKIDVGNKGFTHSEAISNPSGYDVQTTMQICSQDGLSGSCITKNITFTP